MAKETLQERADALLVKADELEDDRKLHPHDREYQRCKLMLRWAILMAQCDTENATRWSREAAEWQKRVQVALADKDNDILAEIWDAVKAHRTDAQALAEL